MQLLKERLCANRPTAARRALSIIDIIFVKKTVWIVGGDGWAYDFVTVDWTTSCVGSQRQRPRARHRGLLEHGRTDEQGTRAPPSRALRRAASRCRKRPAALIAMSYGSIYVARVAMGASDTQTIKAFMEAEAYPGPRSSLRTANVSRTALTWQRDMTSKRQRSRPSLAHVPQQSTAGQGRQEPLQLDSKAASIPLEKYVYMKRAIRCSSRATRKLPSACLKLAQEDVKGPLEDVRAAGGRCLFGDGIQPKSNL